MHIKNNYRNIVVSKLLLLGGRSARSLRSGLFLCLEFTIRGSLTPCIGCNGQYKPSNEFRQREVGCRFFMPASLRNKMKENNEKHVLMQMVEINHNKFAVELVDGNVSANLTQMSKPFGKTKMPNQWLRTTESKDYLGELTRLHKCSLADLLTVRNGGENPGTWCYDRNIVMEFARWLDPNYSIQVNEIMFRLITKEGIYAEKFMGIEPLIHGGKPYYYYMDVLRILGYSIKSGSVQQRKKNFPDHFVKLFGRNFIDLELCHFLKKRMEGIQLALDFNYSSMILKGAAL